MPMATREDAQNRKAWGHIVHSSSNGDSLSKLPPSSRFSKKKSSAEIRQLFKSNILVNSIRFATMSLTVPFIFVL
jgi:hypothetical protein